MIAIVNLEQPEDGDLRTYSLRINNDEICQFKHRRNAGLAVCLEKAAKAARKAEISGSLDVVFKILEARP